MEHVLDHIEIYAPMAKVLAYWHQHALGFTLAARSGSEMEQSGISSYVLDSHTVRLVLTSSYPLSGSLINNEVSAFVLANYCGVKRVALRVPSVGEAFGASLANGAVPIKFPTVKEDRDGRIEEASVKLYDQSEIVFINRDGYRGVFKPGYTAVRPCPTAHPAPFLAVDHIAAEVRTNEMQYWTKYLENVTGVRLRQSIGKSSENKTGMALDISQSDDRKLTFVIAEPEMGAKGSKVQQNINLFGPGIHHLAFEVQDLIATAGRLVSAGVEFVSFPSAYYDLLRSDGGLKGWDIDQLQSSGVLIDREGDSFLLQKFIRPISDRPFFLYEIVQRVNGYGGFALKNINVLKKAEEMEIMTAGKN